MTAPLLDPNEETHLLWTPLPTEPRAIAEELTRLQRARDAEVRAIDARFRPRVAHLLAAYIRAQRSAA